MLIQTDIDVTQRLTEEQTEMLLKAEKMPVSTDAEYPEFTTDELSQFHRISDKRKGERQKRTVTLRLSPEALHKAKSLGKGYTSVLSRIIESSLDNAEIIKKHL